MPRAIVVVGMGLGDEGKGSIVDYLVRVHGAGTVARFNGGAQAAHRVVTADGREHVFSQFGSGSFVPGCSTFLSRFHMLNPLSLWYEAQALQATVGGDPVLERLIIDGQAPLITPFHVAANRLKAMAQEPRRHGTTGQGIGELAWDAQRGLAWPARILNKSTLLRALKADQQRKRVEAEAAWQASGSGMSGPARTLAEWMVLCDPRVPERIAQVWHEIARHLTIVDDFDLTADGRPVVFEGAQGALLDEEFGFAPHTTWSKTTNANALELAAGFDVQTVGVIRAYATRHGEGPLPTEVPGMAATLPEPDVDGSWAGAFRVGYTDLVLARYAADASPVDGLAVTCVDRLPHPWQACSAYRHKHNRFPPGDRFDLITGLGVPTHPDTPSHARFLSDCAPVYDTVDCEDVPEVLSIAMRVPLRVVSEGPTAADKRMIGALA